MHPPGASCRKYNSLPVGEGGGGLKPNKWISLLAMKTIEWAQFICWIASFLLDTNLSTNLSILLTYPDFV